MSRLRVDPYVVALLLTVAAASLLPASGAVATGFGHATTFAIGLLFFLYGARLSTREAVDGFKHWRLHGLVFLATFVLFPLLGLLSLLLVPWALTPQLYTGLMFLCCLPSTVQSSIAFTSIARGNVAAAICSASFSNLIGIALTPLLVTVFLFTGTGGVSLGAVRDIMVQLLAPFVAGQLLRRWIGGFITRHKKVLGYVDRGSILLVVYAAFSEGVIAGYDELVDATDTLLALVAVGVGLGALRLVLVRARRLRPGRFKPVRRGSDHLDKTSPEVTGDGVSACSRITGTDALRSVTLPMEPHVASTPNEIARSAGPSGRPEF